MINFNYERFINVFFALMLCGKLVAYCVPRFTRFDCMYVFDAGLWGIINNAGIAYIADLEMTSDKLFRKVLNVNLLGPVNVTRTFLPLIRLAKGRVINMSSIAGSLLLFMCYPIGSTNIKTQHRQCMKE